ncbi:NAD-dependent epimerase/dehydratase family protein [Mycoplasma sp. ATU-Cv-508]|uniref:NAD-dependent epimerase/dehydratase family protein n=1 Tax=Mycoplasma sp. ATU-Cv-508 TaxID=2048001 RepID=UPI000FDD82C5
MAKSGVKKIIFSSTAAVYGQAVQPGEMINEKVTKNPINPYGESKLMGEKILNDLVKIGQIEAVIFRYFNVAGVSQALSNLPLPENPHLSHLIPIVTSYALGRLPRLTVYGQDYPTPDGTCVRDYIHVEDLAWAHLLAIDYLKSGHSGDFNLGSGQGYSVKQVIETAQQTCQISLKYEVSARRPGDPAWLVTSYAKAQRAFGFKPRASLADMIKSDYQWRAGATKGK